MRLCEIGIERDSLVETRQSFVRTPERDQRAAQQHVYAGIEWLAGQGFAREFSAFGIASFLTRHHRQIVISIAIIWVSAQNFVIARRSVRQRALPMQRQRLSK